MIHKNLLVLLIAIILSSFSSCDPVEPELDIPDNNVSAESNEKADMTDAEIEKIINDNISISCKYIDYTFIFSIKSTVKSRLPNDKIRYGISHKSTSFYEIIHVSVEDQAYYYSCNTYNGVDEVTFRIPFWFYYAFVEIDTTELALCEVFYRSYMDLVDKGQANFVYTDQELYDYCVDGLNKSERYVKYDYLPTVSVLVNNKCYEIKSFQIP